MEERAKPINEERVREAAETGAETLAVACPYCTVMLDDGVQGGGAQMRVVDVATLAAESVAPPTRPAPPPPPLPRPSRLTRPPAWLALAPNADLPVHLTKWLSMPRRAVRPN